MKRVRLRRGTAAGYGSARPDPCEVATLRLPRFCVLVVSLILGCGQARADGVALVVENDSLLLRDRHYTSGLMLAYEDDVAGRRLAFAFGQALYTPAAVETETPDPERRPYAGHLFGALGWRHDGGGYDDRTTLTLGVVGPAAVGEASQKLIHRVSGYPEPQGWGSQLANEPAFNLYWRRTWAGAGVGGHPGGLDLRLRPHAGLGLGSVMTNAAIGATLRLGTAPPTDDDPPGLPPEPIGAAFVPAAGFAWETFVGVEGRAVAHDVFLNGGTFRDGPSVDEEPLVGDLVAGATFRWRRYRLAFKATLRSKQYHEQEGPDRFGNVSLGLAF